MLKIAALTRSVVGLTPGDGRPFQAPPASFPASYAHGPDTAELYKSSPFHA